MTLQATLDAIRDEHELRFLLAINDEGLVIAGSGDMPLEAFSPYAPMAVETARRMADSGGFGEPLCNALILEGGQMLILYQTRVADHVIYLALLCKRVPTGLKKVLQNISAEIGRALGEHKDYEEDV